MGVGPGELPINTLSWGCSRVLDGETQQTRENVIGSLNTADPFSLRF